MKKLTSNKGITLLTLTITIVIMLILSFTISINVSTYVERKQKTNLETDITKLQEEISHYYIENKIIPIANKYTNTDMLKKSTNDNENYYVIDLAKLEDLDLNYGKDYDTITDFTIEIDDLVDIYIINEQSHTIYYPKGIQYDGKIYYTTMNLDSIAIENIPLSSIEITGKTAGRVGSTIQLTANTLPGFAENTGVVWNSNNETLATVDENGKVTLKSAGTVTITATSKDNGTISATYEIIIPEEITIYNYTGNVQEYIVPATGIYKIECWGAQGGNIDTYTGGKGAYTTGQIELAKGNKLYIYVGGEGTNSDIGGYNGGGSPLNNDFGAYGGGATDIRLLNGEWNNTESLISRIMVAGGGGSAENRGEGYGSGNGGSGGEITGEEGKVTNVTVEWGQFPGNGGTQTSGGTTNAINNIANSQAYINGTGSFGMGGKELHAGGGSGYYGGAASYHGGAGGGSSFISGYEGCNAVDSKGNHTNQPYHYSGYVFTNMQMIAGSKEMPTQEGTSTMLGNSGNGYAKITFIQ